MNLGGQRYIGGRSPFRDFNEKHPRFSNQLPLSRNNGLRIVGFQNRDTFHKDFNTKTYGTQRPFPRRTEGRIEGRGAPFRDYENRPLTNDKPFRAGNGRAFYDQTTTTNERRTQQQLRPRPLQMRGGLRA